MSDFMDSPKESLPLGEEEAIDRMIKSLTANFVRTYPPSVRPARRAPHAKGHGCLSAEFIVHDNIAEELRVGLFSAPRSYRAWIRFSNGSPSVSSDYLPDVRGMAIKVLNVDCGDNPADVGSTEQDFVLINHPVFFIRDAAGFADFSSHIKNNKVPLSFFFGWNPTRWRWHEFRLLLASGLKLVPNLLETRYWSQTPYLIGSRAAKYSAIPSTRRRNYALLLGGKNYLRKGMIVRLKDEVNFEFALQLQTSPKKMPVEDPTIEWPQHLSPFQTVARIRVLPQEFNTTECLSREENLSFAPWHSLPEHRPIGGINRARRKMYEVISTLRHQMNVH
jgi:Catalase